MRTADDLRAEILILNNDLGKLRNGERVTQLEVGSGEFARTYRFQQIDYRQLLRERDELQQALDSLLAEASGTQELRFRQTFVPHIYDRGYK